MQRLLHPLAARGGLACAFAIALIMFVLAPPGPAQSGPLVIPNGDDSTSSAPAMSQAVMRPGSARPFSLMSTPTGALNNLLVSARPDTEDYPSQIGDGAGGMIVVWEAKTSAAGYEVLAQHVLSCGTLDPSWPATGLDVSNDPTDDHFPEILSDGSGGALVSWVRARFPYGRGDADVYAQHLFGNGTLDPGWPANGAAVCAASGDQLLQRMTTDGAHGAFLTWDDRRDPTRHVFVQHLLVTGVDPTWPVNGLRACPFNTGQALPQICSDGAGGAIVAWRDNRGASTGVDLRAQRISASGTLLWPTGGAPVCLAPGFQQFDEAIPGFTYVISRTDAVANPIVPDGAGGCFLAWSDHRTFGTTDEDIYAQHLTASGDVAGGWPADGVAICTDPGEQDAAEILSDGAGGAFVSWFEESFNVTQRPGVFVQHVTGSGVVDGPANGLNIGSASAFETFAPVAIADGAGTIFAYSAAPGVSSPAADVFAIRLTASPFGADPAWAAGGAVVSAAPQGQFFDGSGSMVSDGAGGALLSLDDYRNFATDVNDIYAQKILANGVLPVFSAQGTVQGSCPSPVGLLGVTVDAYEVGSGDLVASVPTNGSGAYTIPGLSWGTDYNINAVAPLDYSTGAIDLPVDGCAGTANFALTCVAASGTPQGIGYWKHEVGVATGGNGHGQLTPATLCSYLDLIAVHFNSNEVHPVIIYQPPASGQCSDKLQVAKNLLNLTGSVAMVDRAKQQLMALLMNVAAGNLSQTKVISQDGATVSQAITYCDNVIHSPNGNDSQANDICDAINSGQTVKAGQIPLSTQNITYARWGRSLEFRVTPNPGHGPLHFAFSLPKGGPVDLSVYDVAGRRVTTLLDGTMEAGSHGVTWDAIGPGGMTRVGMYFARLMTREGTATLRVLQMDK
jgi:hypothetical protein